MAGSQDSEDLHRRACATWPRLYLDTAELAGIADGRTEPKVVAELLAAARRCCAILIISIEHLQDALPNACSDTRKRIADALELFPLRAVVLEGPSEIEPWDMTPEDIVIHVAGNTREILEHSAGQPVLRKLSTIQDRLHTVSAISQSVRRSPGAMGKQSPDLTIQCLVTLIGGRQGTDVSEILAGWERESGVFLDEGDRATVTRGLEPWAVLLREVEATVKPTETQRVMMLRSMREAPRQNSPGLYLAQRLVSCLSANVGRTPLRSDCVDGLHAAYFPYVDIATCDRQVYACVCPHLPTIKGARNPQLFRNGHLSEVANALANLPIPMPASVRVEDTSR